MRPRENSWSWFAVYARLIGLRANAIATAVPIDMRSECSAAIASDRNGSFTVSAAQTQSSPAASAAPVRAAIDPRLDPMPVSIFMPAPHPCGGASASAPVR